MRAEVAVLNEKTGASAEGKLNGSGNDSVEGYGGRVGRWEAGEAVR